jgi:hypothetical protein
MLSKENLMAKTSDIGSCLGLLTGKLLIVGFVIGAFSANAMDPKEFDTLNPVALKRRAKEVLSERNALQQQNQELQEQLAAQSAPKTPLTKKRRDALIDAVSNPKSGVFGTPIGGMDTRSIVAELKDVELTGDDVRDFRSLCSLFEVHIRKKPSAASSVTTLARREEDSASEPTDLNDIFNLFKHRLAGVIGSDFLAFYTEKFEVLVVAKSAGSPMKHAMPAIDLNAIG